MRNFNYADSMQWDEEIVVEISFFCEETVEGDRECSTEWNEEFTIAKGEEYKLSSECPYCKATNEVKYSHSEAMREEYERTQG